MDGRTVLLILLSEHNAGKLVAVGYLLLILILALQVRDHLRKKR